jgi:pimeloyl-ACP methyl ester carboxylesterase
MNGAYESDGAHLNFHDSGTGAPIIFLHPTPLDHDYWRPLIGYLSGVRAIVPDLRGHGGSELGSNLPEGAFERVPDAPVLTIAQLATDILALLDHLAIPNAIFVGCSIGGYVLLELWRRTPARVRGMAFVCSKPHPDAEAKLVKRANTIAQVREGAREALLDGMVQSLTGATARAKRPEIVAELRTRMTLSQDAMIAVQAGLAARPDSVPAVCTIQVPVFVVAGGEDTAVSLSEIEAFRVAPGGCVFHVLPDAGHFAAYERPEKVASLLSDWLREPGFK